LLQAGQVAQSQQVHCAHPHTPVLQQSQQAAAFTPAPTGAVAKVMSAETRISSDFMMLLFFL
jgi:hypothetical protein